MPDRSANILGTISPVTPLNYQTVSLFRHHISHFFLPFIDIVDWIIIYPEFDLNNRLHYHFSFNIKDNVKYQKHLKNLKSYRYKKRDFSNFFKFSEVKEDYYKAIEYHKKDWEATSKLLHLSKPLDLNYLKLFKDILKYKNFHHVIDQASICDKVTKLKSSINLYYTNQKVDSLVKSVDILDVSECECPADTDI